MKKFDSFVEIRCPFCGNVTLLSVVEEDFQKWQGGALIQDAMPYMDRESRETLISGICLECQKDVFDDDEDFLDEDWDDDCDDECGFDPYEGCYTFDC